LFGTSYVRATTVETTVNGFRKSGIYPLNSNVLGSHDFVINVEEQGTDCEQGAYEPTLTDSRHLLNGECLVTFNMPEASNSNGSAGASSDSPIIFYEEPTASTSMTPTISSSELVLTENLSRLPSVSKQVVNDGRPSAAGSAKIVTAELETKRGQANRRRRKT
jgi:hypothetical protein